MDRKTKLEKCKSFFHSFTPYQIGYLATVLVLAAVVTIFFPEMMLESTGGVFLITCSVINVIANPVCELLIAKQSKWNFIVDLVFIEGTYVALALALGWYTLAMTCIFFWIPIDIISFVRTVIQHLTGTFSLFPEAVHRDLSVQETKRIHMYRKSTGFLISVNLLQCCLGTTACQQKTLFCRNRHLFFCFSGCFFSECFCPQKSGSPGHQ